MGKHHLSNHRMVNPHHDPSIDAEVISEFARRFPALTFLSFFRNCRGQALHVIEFAGQLADLTAAGIPSDSENLTWCHVTRDRRRKAGTLVATVRIENGPLPSGHPMAWLEPQGWMLQQVSGGVTCVAKRTRPVGRFQRMVSWATDGTLISPNWRAIRVQALVDRLEAP